MNKYTSDLDFDEAKGDQVEGKATVIGPRRLLKYIQISNKFTHHTRTSVADEAGRLAIVHHLCHSVVEEGIIDIQLVDHLIHTEGEREREDSPNGGSLHLVVHS